MEANDEEWVDVNLNTGSEWSNQTRSPRTPGPPIVAPIHYNLRPGLPLTQFRSSQCTDGLKNATRPALQLLHKGRTYTIPVQSNATADQKKDAPRAHMSDLLYPAMVIDDLFVKLQAAGDLRMALCRGGNTSKDEWKVRICPHWDINAARNFATIFYTLVFSGGLRRGSFFEYPPFPPGVGVRLRPLLLNYFFPCRGKATWTVPENLFLSYASTAGPVKRESEKARPTPRSVPAAPGARNSSYRPRRQPNRIQQQAPEPAAPEPVVAQASQSVSPLPPPIVLYAVGGYLALINAGAVVLFWWVVWIERTRESPWLLGTRVRLFWGE
ncbi:hypothetical protein BDK51DRAFT_37110 [Blyttiomyces helicus]|uniref:Uncharacterized protein n=1 Tax=Blyttiomyces helicus TaxID=388810 RepID=A0A4P9WIU4_9FUNG|nr:hypothetical protein BDK51DRAFT_37110 [Blyttiomyces helicus]|eukprot:RKO92811.1 hypothetical protein BDK51DRAFT_37110 [Blyttiomyces helicus]